MALVANSLQSMAGDGKKDRGERGAADKKDRTETDGASTCEPKLKGAALVSRLGIKLRRQNPPNKANHRARRNHP